MHLVQTASPEDLDEFEQWAKRQLQTWVYNLQQNNYFQYELGLLSEEQWKVIARRIQSSWDNCATRDLYTRELDTAFARYVNTLENNCTL